MKIYLVLVISLMVSAISWGQEVDVLGDWTLTLETPQGKRVSQLSISQDSTDGSFWSSQGECQYEIVGDQLSWNQPLLTPIGNFAAEFKGQIKTNDKLMGTFTFSEGPVKGRSSTWEAVRTVLAEKETDAKSKGKETVKIKH